MPLPISLAHKIINRLTEARFKGEVDWLDFGTKSLTLSDGTAINSSLRAAQGKVGVNYKLFGP